MAVIASVIVGGDTRTVTWTPLANGDSGAPIEFGGHADRSIQVFGTFGVGGNLRIEGSNDGTNWATLTDPGGTDLDFTSAKIENVLEITKQLRPIVTSGDGTTSLSVVAFLRKTA